MPRNYHVAKEHILQAMPGTHRELEVASGWSFDTVRRWLKVLRADNQCHVGSWRRPNGSGNFVRVFYRGPGYDVPCSFAPLTPSEDWALKKERAKYRELMAKRKEAATRAEP